MSTIEIACCGMFHQVNGMPWTCKTCGQMHLGSKPPTFLWRAQEHHADLGTQIRTLQDEIVERKHAIERLEVEQEALSAYLALVAEHGRSVEEKDMLYPVVRQRRR